MRSNRVRVLLVVIKGTYEAVREGTSLRMVLRDMNLSELQALREKLKELAALRRRKSRFRGLLCQGSEGRIPPHP